MDTPEAKAPEAAPAHDDSPAAHHKRVAEAWAAGHEIAARKYGESEIGRFFVGKDGLPLLTELETLPFTATAADMLAVVRRHLKVGEPAR